MTSPQAEPGPAPHAVTSPRTVRTGSVPIPTVHPVLHDARLERARALAADHDWPAAAQAVVDADAARIEDPHAASESCAWKYVLGRLLASAARYAEAAAAFDAARGALDDGRAHCPLASFATFRAAEAFANAGDFGAAEARARQVPPDSSVADDAGLVRAKAFSAEGRAAEAVPLWRAALVKNPKVWIDVALPLASALVLGAEGDSAEGAAEALGLVTRVLVAAPRLSESSGALTLRERALARALHWNPKTPRTLTLTERVDQARAWLDAGEAAKAATLMTALLAEAEVAPDASALCAAARVRAQALAKTKTGAAAAWDETLTRCAHDPSLVTALYASAKAVSSKQPDVARARYAQVEERFHDHRLADDARFQGALLALEQGDEATFTRSLLTLPEDYPQGDMKTEALFRVALLWMARGEWAKATPVLDRIALLSEGDQHWATAGRAEYFRARAAEALGNQAAARGGYARVLERHPFAYYMAQAYARLSEGGSALATDTLAEAFRHEVDTPFVTEPHAELETPAFGRALALLEVGDVELARRELALSGATGEGAPPEVLWTVARLYDEADAPELGHAIARQKLHDYLSHYPVGAWKTKWQIAYPRAFADLVVPDSTANGIPAALTWAIMREESDFVADAKSGSSAFGLMQLIVPTAKGVGRALGLPYDEASLKEPKVSVALGTRLLRQLRSTFPKNPTLAIAAYNGGGGAVGRWLAARGDEAFDLWVEEIPWDETRGYEKRVLSSEAAYAYLYDPAALDEVLRTAFTARGGARETVARADGSAASP